MTSDTHPQTGSSSKLPALIAAVIGVVALVVGVVYMVGGHHNLRGGTGIVVGVVLLAGAWWLNRRGKTASGGAA